MKYKNTTWVSCAIFAALTISCSTQTSPRDAYYPQRPAMAALAPDYPVAPSRHTGPSQISKSGVRFVKDGITPMDAVKAIGSSRYDASCWVLYHDADAVWNASRRMVSNGLKDAHGIKVPPDELFSYFSGLTLRDIPEGTVVDTVAIALHPDDRACEMQHITEKIAKGRKGFYEGDVLMAADCGQPMRIHETVKLQRNLPRRGEVVQRREEPVYDAPPPPRYPVRQPLYGVPPPQPPPNYGGYEIRPPNQTLGDCRYGSMVTNAGAFCDQGYVPPFRYNPEYGGGGYQGGYPGGYPIGGGYPPVYGGTPGYPSGAQNPYYQGRDPRLDFLGSVVHDVFHWMSDRDKARYGTRIRIEQR